MIWFLQGCTLSCSWQTFIIHWTCHQKFQNTFFYAAPYLFYFVSLSTYLIKSLEVSPYERLSHLDYCKHTFFHSKVITDSVKITTPLRVRNYPSITALIMKFIIHFPNSHFWHRNEKYSKTFALFDKIVDASIEGVNPHSLNLNSISSI